MNEQNKKRNSIKQGVTTVAFVLIFALITMIITSGFKDWNPYGWFTKTEPVAKENAVPIATTEDGTEMFENETYEMPSALKFTGANVSSPSNASETYTASVTLTATVLPTDATNKEVDWSIDWYINDISDNAIVTDYVTVTPASDGSTTATVTCLQAFGDSSMRITVTTRIGNYVAYCFVSYEGTPTSLNFIYNDTECKSTTMITLSAGNTYDIGLKLQNNFNSVKESGSYEITSIKGYGKYLCNGEYIMNGSVIFETETYADLETGTCTYNYTNSLSETKTASYTIDTSEFLTASISDSTLSIKIIKSETSWTSGVYPRTGCYSYYTGAYQDSRATSPDNCYWTIYVKDTISGQTCMIYVDIVSSVSSVSLNSSSISY